MLLERLWEDMLLKSLDGALIIGLLSTHGIILGEIKDYSELLSINAELAINAMQD